MTRQAKFGLWALVALIVGAASFFVGGALRPEAETHYVLDVQAPAFGEPTSIAATSPGGFTGFGETDGGDSRVVVSGRVVELDESSLVLESNLGQTVSMTFGESPRVFRLESGTRDLLQPGVTVALRLNEAGDTVEGVLVLSQP